MVRFDYDSVLEAFQNLSGDIQALEPLKVGSEGGKM